MMRNFGLIGYPLSHSFSPGYFEGKFKVEQIQDARYDLYPIENISQIEKLKEKNISGLNVTIPYKESVLPYLDEIDEVASAIGAVNTIKFNGQQMIGYNTDAYGFKKSLIAMLDGKCVDRALILGTGGASKAVKYVLEELSIESNFVSRTRGDYRYEDLNNETISTHKLIVNTTPLGMSPNTETFPNIPYRYIGKKHFLYDLVYNPEKTLFLDKGMQQGATIKNGLDMLILQAEKSWSIWNQI